MARPRAYRSFADFQREEIRPNTRAGWSIEDVEDPSAHQELDFDYDPFEAALQAARKAAAEQKLRS